jgi:hypothetical protein
MLRTLFSGRLSVESGAPAVRPSLRGRPQRYKARPVLEGLEHRQMLSLSASTLPQVCPVVPPAALAFVGPVAPPAAIASAASVTDSVPSTEFGELLTVNGPAWKKHITGTDSATTGSDQVYSPPPGWFVLDATLHYREKWGNAEAHLNVYSAGTELVKADEVETKYHLLIDHDSKLFGTPIATKITQERDTLVKTRSEIRSENNHVQLVGSMSCKWTQNKGAAIDVYSTIRIVRYITSAELEQRTTDYKNALLKPSNDNFADAEVLTGVGPSTYGTNDYATSEAGEPGRSNSTKTVWYRWTVPTDYGRATIKVAGTNFRPALTVYEQEGKSIYTLKKIGEDKPATGQSATVNLTGVKKGATYLIAVDGALGTTGQFRLKALNY